MESQASQQFNYIAPASAEINSGNESIPADHAGVQPETSTLVRSVVKEIVGSNRGRLAVLICWDLFTVLIAVRLGHILSPSYNFEPPDTLFQPGVSWLLGLSFLFSALSFGLYERPNEAGRVSLVLRTAIATIMAWALVLLCEYAVTFVNPVGRWIVAISAAILIFVTLSGRLFLQYVQKRMPLNVVVLGNEEIANSIKIYSERRPFPPLRVAVVDPEDRRMSLKFLSYIDETLNTINWVVLQGSCEGSLLESLLPFFKNGTRLCDVPMFFEGFFQKVPIEFIDTNWLIQANVSLLIMASRLVKRAADVFGALVGLILTLPLWPAIAFAIKLSDKGPVLYHQERIGRHGQVFRVLKFRTMSMEAESSGKAVWAKRGDSRVTPVGRFLRKTRLDEIPQFINVLLGHMSLVGPRPERPEFVETLVEKVPHYKLRHLVRPGITGWAQINYRYAASLEDSAEKLRYDLYYVKYGGLLLDLQIIIRTIGVMMRGSR